MAIKVQFPVGEATITVRGLYQWDYGQVLEIECAEIGSEILEAHFACSNVSEAIVRTCTFSNGLGTVTIPDECLEQTGSLTVWLCRVDSSQRHTIKAVTLPLTARARPNNTRDVPADYVDKYGQLIEEVNEAINALENGDVTAAMAISAKSAENARTAASASSATYATSAGRADYATEANHAANAANAAMANNANIANTINKYQHNLRMDLQAPNGKGALFLQFINDRSEAMTMDNITSHISPGVFDYEKPIPCSGYISYNGTMYIVGGLGFGGNTGAGTKTLYPAAFGNNGDAIGYGFSTSYYTVAYDNIIRL